MRPRLLMLVTLLAFPVALPAQTSLFDGRPQPPQTQVVNYYVWRDGQKWHVRWLSLQRANSFTGEVTADSGAVGELQMANAEQELLSVEERLPFRIITSKAPRYATPIVKPFVRRKIEKVSDSRIVFDSRVDRSIDGFDFLVSPDATRLHFVLKVNGRLRPDLVVVGRDNHAAEALPLIVPLK